MNTDTGKVYDTPREVIDAMVRGEKLAQISRKAAKRLKLGRRLLAQKLRGDRRKQKRRKRDAIAKASRKANR